MNSPRAFTLRQRQFLISLLALGVLVRIAIRVAFGEAYFWTHSYGTYYQMAENVTAGKGFCLATTCAWWPPLYPAFLALTTFAGKHYLLIVIPQALLGAGTALCACLIGRRLFHPAAGILACAIVALYPYYVMHDTALQETGMVTFWTALFVLLLLRAASIDRPRDWLLAGLVAGLIALTRASTSPTVGVALLWTLVWGSHGSFPRRLRSDALLLLAFLAIVAPWLVRTWRVTGAPVLSSQTGRALWIGNNPLTFSAYPARSIDISESNAWGAVSPADRAEVGRLEDHEVARSDWFARRAFAYIRAYPLTVAGRAFRKIAAGFSWRLNPAQSTTAQIAYALSYVPIAVLGTIGMILARRNAGVILILLLFLAFSAVTAVFWAHTSHRSYLDVYWIVLAAAVVFRTQPAIARKG